ncbi:hypothetical protein [Rheinheimera sp.]|uniref:hypothetical protein n=1 Tax=Rheinheimera sp. TaxID=1869214 RepID=UPI0023525D63|nr:hypothetical protein [Rheinheimera sp.]
MLINTVLVYIRELLPVLLLLATLLRLQHHSRRWLWQSTFLTAVMLIVLPPWLGDITQLADGTGLEWLFILAHLSTLIALFILLAGRMNSASVLALCAQALLCGINLLLYGLTNIGTDNSTESFWLGAVLGVGIGASIAVIWYQLMAELQRVSQFVLGLMLALIGARQGIETVTLLGQIDMLPSGEALWDSSALVSEHTEVGVFFQAWFGYEATPDMVQLGSWLMSFILILMLWQWRRGKL